MLTLALIPNLGPMEYGIILVVGLLIFGKRLPDMGRSLGKSIVEFRKGIKGIEDEVDSASTASRPAPPKLETSSDARSVSREATRVQSADSVTGSSASSTNE